MGGSEQKLFFPTDQSFETAEDAEAYALMLAQRWIDRENSNAPRAPMTFRGTTPILAMYTPM